MARIPFSRRRPVKQARPLLHPVTSRRRPPARFSFGVFILALVVESAVLQMSLARPNAPASTPVQTTAKVAASSEGSVAGVVDGHFPTPTPVVATPTPEVPSAPVNTGQVLASAPAAPLTQPVLLFRQPLAAFTYTQYFSSSHTAVDMAAPYGAPIVATAEGTVVGTGGLMQGGGLMVEIDHGNGYRSYYAHLSRIFVRNGDRVTHNSQIGAIGTSGWSTGPHLHFMLTKDGRAVNPRSVLQ